jgi:hypothetical protein
MDATTYNIFSVEENLARGYETRDFDRCARTAGWSRFVHPSPPYCVLYVLDTTRNHQCSSVVFRLLRFKASHACTPFSSGCSCDLRISHSVVSILNIRIIFSILYIYISCWWCYSSLSSFGYFFNSTIKTEWT